MSIEASSLTMRYRGSSRDITALDAVDLDIESGSVFGLLGPNGAGKTTLVKVLVTLLLPTSGTAKVAGFDVVREREQATKKIGFVLGGERGLYPRLSGRQNLEYFSALWNIPRSDISGRINSLLKQVELDDNADRRVEEYSRGMRQRLHIARGLLTDPEVLFLDEPTIGLDPRAARSVRRIISEQGLAGRTVLLTTHYMFEAEELASRLAIIDGGRIVLEGSPTEIKGHAGSGEGLLDCQFYDLAAPELHRVLERADGVRSIGLQDGDGYIRAVVTCGDVGVALRSVSSDVIQAGGRIGSIAEREMTLEDAYLSILDRNRRVARD